MLGHYQHLPGLFPTQTSWHEHVLPLLLFKDFECSVPSVYNSWNFLKDKVAEGSADQLTHGLSFCCHCPRG